MQAKKDQIRVAVTGGPGAGKTSLLQELERRGYTIVPEVARSIIAERKAKGLSPRPEPLAFAQAIFDRDVQQYVSTSVQQGLGFVFFDRSILDSLAMLAQLMGLTASEVRTVLEKYRYHPKAIILPPWREIYQVDSERDQSYEEAVRVYESLRGWYIECGYSLIEVPPGSVDVRSEFVLRALVPDAA
jgi:predicted ATPase